jgi:hypothetical protein
VRVYVGERELESGRCRLWVVHEESGPDLTEVVELLAELRRLSQPLQLLRDTGSEREQRRAEVLARKDALVAQLKDAAERPPALELSPGGPEARQGFGWGGEVGGSALAHEILLTEFGEEPPPEVYRKFREDVVDRFWDRWSFRLPAQDVWTWIEENRRLIEHELFERRPPASGEEDEGTALAVTTTPAPHVENAVSEAAGSSVVRACEEAWTAIRAHHPELPDAVMVLGTGVERGRLVKLGHWWAGRWTADGEPRGEVLLAGEALHLKPEEVFEVLLHEAAHGLNAARGIKDTSRGGRYHNARFGDAAREVGLVATAMPPYGLARTSLSAEARERYAQPIERLGEVMRIARQIERGVRIGAKEGGELDGRSGGERQEGDGGTRTKGRALAVCGCGRKVRVAPTVLAAGPIVCGLCEREFTSGREQSATRSARRDAVVDRTFVDRRHAALGAESRRAGDTETVERRHGRIEAALRAAELEGLPKEAMAPLAARLTRLEALAATTGATLPEAPPPATADQRRGLADLRDAFSEEDRVAAGSWYERFGTLEEQPMPAEDGIEAERRARLARALLRADGTLRGPDVDIGGRQYTAGDRVVAAGDDLGSGLPAGTPGTVEVVDVGSRHADIDFATWGRLKVSVEKAVANLLRHDYAEQGHREVSGPAELDRDRGVELELQRSWTEKEG